MSDHVGTLCIKGLKLKLISSFSVRWFFKYCIIFLWIENEFLVFLASIIKAYSTFRIIVRISFKNKFSKMLKRNKQIAPQKLQNKVLCTTFYKVKLTGSKNVKKMFKVTWRYLLQHVHNDGYFRERPSLSSMIRRASLSVS